MRRERERERERGPHSKLEMKCKQKLFVVLYIVFYRFKTLTISDVSHIGPQEHVNVFIIHGYVVLSVYIAGRSSHFWLNVQRYLTTDK